MIGHVYCKFTDEEDASDALQVMNGRYYDGRKMEVEFSPVQNFQEVRHETLDKGTRPFRTEFSHCFTVRSFQSCRLVVVTLTRKTVPGVDSATSCTSNRSRHV